MLTEALKRKFETLSNNLSPENLCCDGELSRAQVRVRYRKLKRQWAALEKKAGRKVSEDEVWDWFWKKGV